MVSGGVSRNRNSELIIKKDLLRICDERGHRESHRTFLKGGVLHVAHQI